MVQTAIPPHAWLVHRRDLTNPTINTLSIFGSDPLTGLPAWPIFETFLGIVLVVGIAYYAVALRGRVDHAAAADIATGETAIA